MFTVCCFLRSVGAQASKLGVQFVVYGMSYRFSMISCVAICFYNLRLEICENLFDNLGAKPRNIFPVLIFLKDFL